MLHPIRSLVSASLISVIAACAIASSAPASSAPVGYPYSKKQTYTNKHGDVTTVYLRKDNGVAGALRTRRGGEGIFVPGALPKTTPKPRKSSAFPKVLLARLATDRTITDPAPRRAITDRTKAAKKSRRG